MAKKADTAETQHTTMTPPHSLEFEQSVLGSILLRPAVMDELADMLSPSDFYREAHGRIYRTMLELYQRNEPIDLKTVQMLLLERGLLEEIGGPLFLTGLSDHVGIAANAAYYARKVREKALVRRLLARGQEIVTACLSPVENVGELLDWAEQTVYEAQDDGQDGQEIYVLDDLIPEEQTRIEQIYYRKREILGVPSGFIDLDLITSGWQNSDLIILAARPSMGKTAMGLNMACHAAKTAKVPVGFFSMEQSRRQLTQRLMASEGRINASKMRAGKLSDAEWVTFAEVPALLEGVPVYIIDRPAMTLMQIRAQARRLKLRYGIGLIVVDYLQLAHHPNAKSRVEEVGAISQGLKTLAKEMNLPVIALSQLNREVEKRPNKRPGLPDLKGSGDIEQDADVVLFIYRDQVYRPDSKDRGKAEIIVSKQRNGPTGKVKLAFLEEYLLFTNLAADPAEDAVF